MLQQTGQVDGTLDTAGVNQSDYVGLTTGVVRDAVYKAVHAWATNDGNFWVLGMGAVENDATVTTAVDLNRVFLGVISANTSCTVKNIRIWDKRLTNSQMQNLN